jgi:uncharacterized protein
MDTAQMAYWPWWIGGPALAGLVMTLWLVERRLLGVTGSYIQALTPPSGSDALARASDSEIEDALMKATLAEFGPEALAEFEASAASAPASQEREPLPRTAHRLFLAMLPVGGALGALLAGRWALRADLGVQHGALVAQGVGAIAALFLGGLLVGFGVRMAGGCTSGHGLSGCSRLQPGSLVTTASFFGTGVVVSYLLEAWVK